MAQIDVSAARTSMPLVRPSASKTVEMASNDSGDDTAPLGQPRKSVLMTALDMSDDLSGLVSSMRRSRTREDGSGDVRGQAWLDHVLDPQGPEKLQQLKQQLCHLGTPDLAALRSLLAQAFPDPSDALAVLRAFMADDELIALREELAALSEELSAGSAGRRTRGGVNVALKARLQAPTLRATPQQLRRSYQDFLAGDDPLDAYERWIELYGFERRGRIVDFIEQALAADMYALDPSCSRLEFGHLLQRVRQLCSLRSADHLLHRYCWRPQVMSRTGVDQRVLCTALLDMVRHQGSLQHLFRGVFAAARHVMDSTEKTLFAQGIRRFLTALPHGLWADIGLQADVIGEVDVMLDQAIRIEQASRRRGHHVEA